jgi:hypothetical protein
MPSHIKAMLYNRCWPISLTRRSGTGSEEHNTIVPIVPGQFRGERRFNTTKPLPCNYTMRFRGLLKSVCGHCRFPRWYEPMRVKKYLFSICSHPHPFSNISTLTRICRTEAEEERRTPSVISLKYKDIGCNLAAGPRTFTSSIILKEKATPCPHCGRRYSNLSTGFDQSSRHLLKLNLPS